MPAYTSQPSGIVPVSQNGLIFNAAAQVLMLNGAQAATTAVGNETVSGVTSNVGPITFNPAGINAFPHSITDDTTPFMLFATFRPKGATSVLKLGNASYGIELQFFWQNSNQYYVRLSTTWRGNAALMSGGLRTFPADVPVVVGLKAVRTSTYVYALDFFFGGTKYSTTYDSDPAFTPTKLDIGIGFGVVYYDARTPTDTECFDLLTNLYSIFTDAGASHSVTASSGQQANTASSGAIHQAITSHPITISSSQQVNTASACAISSPIGSDAYIDIPEFRDWGTGNLQPGLTGVQVDVRNIATGTLIVRKTGQTSHATTAVCRVTDPLMPHATLCEVVVRHAGKIGIWDLMSV